MSGLHVIQVSSFYPPHLGGQENAVHDLAQQLAAAGHRVEVLASARGAPKSGMQKENQVRVHRLPAFEFGHAPIMPQFAHTLTRIAQPHSIIHLHIGQAFTPEMVWLVSRLRGIPFVVHMHIDFEPSGPAGFLLPLYKKVLLGPVLRAASAVAVLNQQTQNLVAKAYGVQAHILPNGINEVYFQLKRKPLAAKPPKTLRLLFVGRLSRQKNVITLLEALHQMGQSAHLDVIGDGEERQAVAGLVQYLRLKNVRLHGRLSRDEVRPFYETSDALVLPSLYEAQPLVLLEAMAARLPIIGTNVIGVGEHIKNIGIIAAPTVSGLCRGFSDFRKQYHQLPTMVEHGCKKVQAQHWQQLLKKYETFYGQAAYR